MKNITEARERMGISQEQLAARLGVSRQTVYRWEKGKSNPPTSAVLVMADLFGCSTDWLLGLAD